MKLDKIKIRRINSEYQPRLETRNMFRGRGTKTEKKDYDNSPISCLYYFYCTIRRECMREWLWQCQGHYLCSWIIWAFCTPLGYHEGMYGFVFSTLLVLPRLSKATKDLMDTDSRVQHQPH